jgi:Domain of unknown function (DUF4253)
MRDHDPVRPAVSVGGYTPGMDADDLPGGLPPGSLVAPDPRRSPRWTDGPVCWVSAQPLADAPQQWARLHAIRDRTGLWPVLLPRLQHAPWACNPGEVDALDAETILLEKWRYLVRLHQQRVGDRLWMAEGPQGVRIIASTTPPEGFEEVPEGVRVLDCLTTRPEGLERVVFVEERAKRFVTWPGLAAPGAAGRDPDAVAGEVVTSLRLGFTPFLGLVPVARSADIPAVIGWGAEASDLLADEELSAVLRSWEQRFGARVVALTDAMYVSVAAPPRTHEHAEHLALEHLLLCSDNLWDGADETLAGYVDQILGADLWKFRWDD